MSTTTAQPAGTNRAATPPAAPGVAAVVAAAREAQATWAARSVRGRLRVLRRMRHAIGRDPMSLAGTIASPARGPAERLASEVLPLADAIRFLEGDAVRLLKPKRYGPRGRPLWLGRVGLEVRREPLGVVLVVSPANYPLLLAGVQAVQALAAGNAVLVKPAPGHTGPVRHLADMATTAGLDPRLLVVLGEDNLLVADAAAAGVDKVFLTGSAETGQAVLSDLAPHLVPAVMELSGHDAVFVCDGADLDVVARCVAYGLTFNGGSTCIAPRRVFVGKERAAEFEAKLVEALATREAPDAHDDPEERQRRHPLSPVLRGEGGGDGPVSDSDSQISDLGSQKNPSPRPSPLGTGGRGEGATSAVSIIPVRDTDHALALSIECPYRLGAAVFGPGPEAQSLAGRIDAGCVVVNDVIVPTADPRLPFGGRGRSGFGVTRGAEGLLEMTRIKAVATRRGSFRPHLGPSHPLDAELFCRYAGAAHGATLMDRLRGAAAVVSTLMRRSKRP